MKRVRIKIGKNILHRASKATFEVRKLEIQTTFEVTKLEEQFNIPFQLFLATSKVALFSLQDIPRLINSSSNKFI